MLISRDVSLWEKNERNWTDIGGVAIALWIRQWQQLDCNREFSIFLCSWHQIFIYYPIENNEPSFPLITTNTLTLLWPGLIYGLLTCSLGSFLSQLLLNICCVIFADVTVLCAIKNQPFDFSKNSFPYLQEVTWLSQYLKFFLSVVKYWGNSLCFWILRRDTFLTGIHIYDLQKVLNLATIFSAESCVIRPWPIYCSVFRDVCLYYSMTRDLFTALYSQLISFI